MPDSLDRKPGQPPLLLIGILLTLVALVGHRYLPERRLSIDSSRGDAYFNLGVLYKDFRAYKQNDPDQIKALQKGIDVSKQAKDFFQQFLSKTGSESDKAEAKANIADIDKYVKQIEQFITQLKNQPPMPAAPAAPAAPAGKS